MTLCISHFFATANYYDQAFLKVLPKVQTWQRQRYFLSILDCIFQTVGSEWCTLYIDAYNIITVPLWTLHPEGNQIFFAMYCLKIYLGLSLFSLFMGKNLVVFSILTVVSVIMEQLTKVWKDLLERKKKHTAAPQQCLNLYFSVSYIFFSKLDSLHHDTRVT